MQRTLHEFLLLVIFILFKLGFIKFHFGMETFWNGGVLYKYKFYINDTLLPITGVNVLPWYWHFSYISHSRGSYWIKFPFIWVFKNNLCFQLKWP